jgi:hypothetical protein
MKSFAFAAIIGAVVAVDDLDMKYMLYMAKFGKQYNSIGDFNVRKANFAEADSFINKFNSEDHSHTVGHNQFSDWSADEYKVLLGRVSAADGERKKAKKFDTSKNDTDVNWVDAGAVTPVKDQGACGSCWAFGTTGSLEGAHFVTTGTLVSFSEQQLVDCAGANYGDYGCYGGLQTYAYNYYEASHDAMTEDAYPYTSGGGQMTFVCNYDSS